ncbi:DUF2252 domain-containing protein [Paractinoplanes atraurantiacus]|uniref:Uncharacterized conserved protein, DUF2252 family n=1 Tax=Paractinoplanes atraurantiacus TaxID=1036182 RepID=A0A285HZ22_9ACTN|nr:DUF2252 domain-containing protein [Actinoplanes atraurantiacus]SNY40883.1 Uncharacterized conserved protein, DUF2252 family [Actinoplanes atraurantiacus]
MQQSNGHVVVDVAQDDGFVSLRRSARPRAERYELGRSLRERAHRSEMAFWTPPAGRADPVQQVIEANRGRQPWLIPVRVGRMISSPYAYLRGSANVMADDFAGLPSTGITPVICGDAHLGNFGFYASPERELVFDLNDFDEAHPGAWEWDLRRLAVSVYVAGRQNGFREGACADAVEHCVEEYQVQIAHLAEQPLLARSFDQLDVDRLRSAASRASFRDEIERAARRARRRTSDRALPRFTERRDGSAKLVEEPPLITRPSDEERDQLAEALDGYLNTLPPHWARILAGYRIVDIAHKVVGVGSVGLRAYVALCEGSSSDDVVFLQLKQARRSVIARHQHGDSAWHRHQGQRVVEYQQALQTVSDPLLGWTTVGDTQFYVRQFRDMKGAIVVEGIDAGALADYAGICGYLLAKSHARTSGASMIAGYIGGSGKLAEALCRFSRAYADQVESDHAALSTAVRQGRLPAETV